MPATLYRETETMLAFADIAPKAPTHALIIPRKHIATLNDLKPEDATLVGEMVLLAKELAFERGFAQTGYRLVWNCNQDAGQVVFHIHLHLLGGRNLTWPPG